MAPRETQNFCLRRAVSGPEHRAAHDPAVLTITEKDPTSASTIKALLGHYAKPAPKHGEQT